MQAPLEGSHWTVAARAGREKKNVNLTVSGQTDSSGRDAWVHDLFNLPSRLLKLSRYGTRSPTCRRIPYVPPLTVSYGGLVVESGSK